MINDDRSIYDIASFILFQVPQNFRGTNENQRLVFILFLLFTLITG
jgi:hypothetical protein